MAKVILRQEAINDLSDIWYYTLHKWSEKQADKYYNDIKIACKEIGENPTVGKNYTDISEQLLGFKSGKHILFYLNFRR
jgi:toxin ParE1/3/4